MPAVFEDGFITCVSALIEPNETNAQRSNPQKLSAMLKPAGGFKLLSLLCTSPPPNKEISGEQLPRLIDLQGQIHYPVGVVAAGKIGEKVSYEIHYCSLTKNQNPAGLEVTNNAVSQNWPKNVGQNVKMITDLYVIYMVQPNTVILSVQSGDGKTTSTFKDYEGFVVK